MKPTKIKVKLEHLEDVMSAISKVLPTRYQKECVISIDQLRDELAISTKVPWGILEMVLEKFDNGAGETNPKETPSPIPEGTDNDGAPLWPVKATASLEGLGDWSFKFHEFPLIKSSLNEIHDVLTTARSGKYISNQHIAKLMHSALNIAFWHVRNKNDVNKSQWHGEIGPEYDDQ